VLRYATTWPPLLARIVMPSVQTRLTGFSNVSDVWKPTATKKSGQRKLTELKKVVSIKGGAVNFDISELLEARELLEASEVTVTHILDSLRRLSCLDVTREMLLQTKIGPAIRCVCCSNSKQNLRLHRLQEWFLRIFTILILSCRTPTLQGIFSVHVAKF
jgi:hypothetical protein